MSSNPNHTPRTAQHFKVGDRVTDGLIHGTVTALYPDPAIAMVGVTFEVWPGERPRWDWMSEERLELDT